MSLSTTQFADGVFLSKAADTDSAELNQKLLRETHQSFQDWLEDLSASETHKVESTSVAYAPNEINFEGTLTMNGHMAGIVFSPAGTLILGEKGEVDGDIFVDVAIIHGTVRGDIRAAKRVELGSVSKVIGDIEATELSIQPGAIFEGRCIFSHPAEAALADSH